MSAEPFDFAGITDALDQIVSVVTGFKQKMIDAGFSEEIAELAAMQLVQRLLTRP